MPSRPARIMFVDTCTEMAGGQYSLLTLLKRLDRSKYVPLVYSPKGSTLGVLCRDLGIETHTLPFRSIHLVSHSKLRLLAWTEDAIRSTFGIAFLAWSMARKHIDVVHANTFKAALVASLACLVTRRPLVFHDRITIRHGLLERMVARLSTKIIVVSSALAAKHGEALRAKVTLIYDGVDTDYMAPGRVSAEVPGDETRTTCYLGRISWEKGVDRLIEAAALVTARLPGARFLIGGSPYTPDDDSYQRKLLGLVESLDLVAAIRFTGHVEDARAFMTEARVVVLPSRRESLGLAVLEAMALEKAVVAFAVDGPREIITDGKDGLLVEPDNVERLADAIFTMLEDDDFARQAGKMGRQTVISRFSAKTLVDRISGLYDEIVGLSSPEDGDAN
jgi:glycosyltransferase involved in cell wall biosynthesis